MGAIEIALLILATGVVLSLAFVLGNQQSYQAGYRKGFADGLEEGRGLGAQGTKDIRFEVIAPKATKPVLSVPEPPPPADTDGSDINATKSECGG